MYFVTTKREGYTLFCLSPSERFALGVTPERLVQLLVRTPAQNWELLREWSDADYSYTTLMAALRHRDEPAAAADWLGLLPAELSERSSPSGATGSTGR